MLSPYLLLLIKDLTLSQLMPPCDFCSPWGSLSKFSHLSLLLPPPLCNSTNSLNDRKGFLMGSFTNQVTCMGGVRPVISCITGKLSWLSMSGRTLITALVSKDRATQVIENTGTYDKTTVASLLTKSSRTWDFHKWQDWEWQETLGC